jgi:hypothetical protein
MSPTPLSRRRLLATTGLAVALAGCVGSPRGSEASADGTTSDDTDNAEDTTDAVTEAEGQRTSSGSTDATATDSPDPDTAVATPSGTGTVTTEEAPDLREANVVDVAFERSGGSFRFSVTLYHDDDGETGYADWWQVETLDGERLGRRTLLHAHSTAPFTRSETITVPEGVTYVVVRGHDQTHGYGGQAMVISLDSGETETVRQGPEPRDFSGYEPRI